MFVYGNGGTVENVTLDNVNVTDRDWVGGLVGVNYGNNTGKGTVTGNSITDGTTTYYTGKVTLTIGTGAAIVGGTGISNVAADSNGQVSFTPTSAATVTADNIYHSVSGLNNVTASGGSPVNVNGTTYYASNSSVTLKTNVNGAIIGEASAKGGSVTANDDGTATLTTSSAATVTPTFYYAVNVPNCVDTFNGTSITVSNTKYYRSGSTLNLTAKTGYVVDNVTVSVDTSISATVDTTNHYAFSDGDTYTLATAENIGDYPDLVQVYALTLPEGVSVNSGIYIVDNGKYYATSTVTLTATGYTSTVTVDADHTEFTDIIKFNKAGTGVEVDGTKGDFSTNSGIYSITASQDDSTLKGNGKNNTIILNGGGGSTVSTPLGTDVLKVDGSVTGVYFDRDASNKKSATFTTVVTYDSNDVAAATLKIWDTSGSSGKQAVISASKLKKFFCDDSELSTDLLQQVADLGKLDGIGELNLPAVDPLIQSAQATFNGGDNG